MDASTEERVVSLFQTKERKVRHTYRWLGGFALGFTVIIIMFFPVFGDRSGLDYIQETLGGNIDKNIEAVGSGENWTIDGDTVYVNDPYVFLSATPHTLGSSGWVKFSATSKQYEGDVDVIWGFNSTTAKPKQPQVWVNYTHHHSGWHLEEVYQNVTIKNVTAGINLGIENYSNYTVNYGNENNTKLWQVNYTNPDSTTANITIAFLSQQHQGNNYRFYFNDNESVEYLWNETFFDWKDADLDFTVINRTFRGMDTWYLLTQNFQQNKEYKLRTWVDIPFGGLEGTDGKYWWAMKRSDETLEHAIQNNNLYYLDPWWNASWNYFRTITLDSSKIDNPLNGFPILVAIPDATADKCDGGDSIRFLLPDNSTELPYEIEQWTDGSDRIVWVNVSRVESGSDSVILMYYNNSGASDGQNITGTWNDEYMAVWHMSSLNDSTSNDVDLINTGADYVSSGLIGGCYDYVSANTDFLTHATFLDVIPATDELTFETYVESDSFAVGAYPTILTKENILAQDRIYFRFEDYPGTGADDELALFAEGTNDGANFCTEHTVLTVDTPYYCVGMYKKDTALKIIRDGTIITTGDACSNIRDGTYTNFCIGSHTGDAAYFDGEIDEVRVSSIIRNDSWIKATFHSQNQTTDFLSWGSEQSGGAPANNAPVQSNALVWDGTTADINHTGVIIPVVSFNITINDADGDKMTVTLRTNASGTWKDVNSSGNLDNGTYSNNTNVSWVDSYNTKYWISFNLTDGTDWDNNTYYFTTKVNTVPVNSNPYPSNAATGIPLAPDTINITVADVDDAQQDMTITFRTNESGTWKDADTNASVNNGTYYCLNTSWVNTGTTKYWWSVNTTDSCGGWDNDTYYFTTLANNAPTFSGEYPSNTSTDITLNPTCAVIVTDIDVDTMDVTFASNYTGSWANYQTNNTVSTGTNVTWDSTNNFRTASKKYWWKVYADDGIDNITVVYHFTTSTNFTNGDGTSEDPYQITNCEELNWTRDDLDAYYILMNDINMSDCGVTNWNGGEGFRPIWNDFDGNPENEENYFRGNFNGNTFIISNLSINRPSDIFQGLFGILSGTVANLSLTDVNIIGGWFIGGLTGVLIAGEIDNCSSTGNVNSTSNLIGGLVGYACENSEITNCYSKVDVLGSDSIGGLIGLNEDGTVTNCYSTGLVTGDTNVGGLVGDNDSGSITNCYWDNETSGQTTSDGGTGRTTAQMTYDYEGYDPPEAGLYEDWDLDTNASGSSIWVHDDTGQNDGYPLFRWQYIESPTWHIVSSDKNGTYTNTTQWNTITNVINGSYINTSTKVWNVVDITINGSYSNSTTWSTISTTINGTYTNSTIFKMVSSDKNGSYINTTKWKIISSIINGSYTNTTTWNLIDTTINGSYSNTTTWKTIIDTINGSYANTSTKTWQIVDDTINGTYTNSTTFKVVSSDKNGTYSNTTTYHIIDSAINGTYSNTTSWDLIDTTINGSYVNSTAWLIEDSTINGSYINTTIWNTISNTINGTYTNISVNVWNVVDITINGTYTNSTTFKMVSSDKNGSYINTTKWKIISSIINGSYTNTTIWSAIDSTINGSYSNTTIWNLIDSTINGSYSNITIYHIVDSTINGTYTSITAWQTIINTLNGTYSNTTNWVLEDSTINGTYLNTSIPPIIVITNEYPTNNSYDIPLQPTSFLTIQHADGYTMNITFYYGNSTINCTTEYGNNTNINNGTYNHLFINATTHGTTYHWKVVANDGTNYHNETYLFTTESNIKIIQTPGFEIVTFIFACLGVIIILMLKRRKEAKEQ